MARIQGRFSANLFRELWTAAAALVAILVISSTGFHFIEGWTWFDALYMVIITLSTVGYGEIHGLSAGGRAWAMVTIFAGVGTMSFTFLTIARLAAVGVVEGELRRGLARRRMKRAIETIRDHYVVCGFGRIGQQVARGLQGSGAGCVVVEADERNQELLEREGFAHIIGDATDDDVLRRAGVERARGLAIVTPSDPDNLYITLTARELNPALFVLARANDTAAEHRLTRAGADRAMSPHVIGGRQMASSLLRPTVVELWDLATGGDSPDIAMEEMGIGERSELVGRALADSGLRERFSVIIVAIKRDGTMLFNPTSREVLCAGDTLIYIGQKGDLDGLADVLQPGRGG